MALDHDLWDRRIRSALTHRVANFDERWRKNREYTRNSQRGKRLGNLVQRFIKVVQSRLISRSPVVAVTSDDPSYQKEAFDLVITANNLVRVLSLKRVANESAIVATWASTGWIEVGHKLDPHSLDILRSIRLPQNETDISQLEDDYVPVSQDSVEAYLGSENIDEIASFDAFQQRDLPEEDIPKPAFEPGMGLPWMQEVSPFFVVLPIGVANVSTTPWIAKLHVLSKAELKYLTDTDVENVSFPTRYKESLLAEIPDGKYIEDPILLAQVYIRRDRNAPLYNGWYFVYVVGHPDVVIDEGPNPWGGLIPLIAIKTDVSKNVWDQSPVEDLIAYADKFDLGVQAVSNKLEENLNTKILLGQGVSFDEKEMKKFRNKNYKGPIHVNGDVNQVKVWDNGGLPVELMQFTSFFSRLAQDQTNFSDLDSGKSIKNITARQTDALLQASGVTLEGMRDVVADSMVELVIKLMYLLGLYGGNRTRKFRYGNQVATMDAGTHDFTTSYIYKIEVKDMDPPANTDTQLVMINLLRTIAMDPTQDQVMIKQFNWPNLAQEVQRRFGFAPEVLASQQEREGNPMLSMGEESAGQPGGNVVSLGGTSNEELEHPERISGEQGVPNTDNLLSGLRQQGLKGG